jgi:hypothetical protein
MVRLTKERIQLIINSEDREEFLQDGITPSTPSQFLWKINDSIDRISEIFINCIHIPFSYYIINSTNNTIIINGSSITIPDGNYTANSIIPVLQNEIDAVLGGVSAVSFIIETYKFSITNTSAILVSSVDSNPASTLAPLLGFRQDSISSTVVESDSAINLSGTPYIRLNSNYLTNPIHHKMLYSNDNYQDTLIVVPVSTSPGNIISYNCQTSIRFSYKIAINRNHNIDISLTDSVGNILDLNGSNWYMKCILITE